MKTDKKTTYHPIAKRNACSDAQGAVRNFSLHIRVNRYTSARLASLQGLCYSNGKQESLGLLFETVCLPAIEKYAADYAQKAARTRQERSAQKGRVK